MIGGIYYNIDSGEASVTYYINNWNYNHYKGDIVIPETVTFNNVTYPVTSIGSHAFNSCPNLISVVMPNSIREIGPFAFQNCSSLANISFGNAVTRIDSYAFTSCTSLASVVLPNSILIIDNCAFNNCTKMTSIVLPNSVISIGNDAFRDCMNLSSIYLRGEGEWSAGSLPNTISNLFIDDGITSVKGFKVKPENVYCYGLTPPICNVESFTDYTGILHVPSSSIAAYFTAPYWKYFYNIMGDAVEPSSIKLSQTVLEITLGNQELLTAMVLPNGAYPNNITWKSTNPRVATVSDGIITSVATGDCDIIASCLFLQAICHVIVKDQTTILTLDQHDAQVLPNHIITLTVSGSSNTLPELSVISSDPTVAGARVLNGVIQVVGIKEGTVHITVGSTDGTAQTDSCIVTVFTEIGDVNCDGFVNISDVTTLIDYLLGSEPTSFKINNADINADDNVNIADVTNLIDLLLCDSQDK